MHKYIIVNSFGRERFTGNPVAVFFDCDDLDVNSMQKIAAELNLSETTFICSPVSAVDANVKIFTPVNELSFAGHPLLGTALAISMVNGLMQINLETLKGVYQFSIKHIKSDPFTAYIAMDQPSPIISPFKHQQSLLDALGLISSILPIEMYDVGPRHVFVGLENATALSQIKPDYRKLSAFSNMATLCYCPDSAGGWRLRMFSPAYGVTEDAATGSAAGPLALHLSRYGLAAFGQKIQITQGVEIGRPSQMDACASMVNDKPIIVTGGYGYHAASGNYLI